MKYFAPIFFLFATSFVFAQAKVEVKLSPDSLYQEGLALLGQEAPRAFDKALALGKFRKSLQLLSQGGEGDKSLERKNRAQILALIHFFEKVSNRDSLLQTTRFFPDSTFQAAPQYSPVLKSLIPELLDIKRRNTRKEFSKIDGLNYRRPSDRDLSFILTFETYWPLEVIEFETHFSRLEKTLKSNPEKIRDEFIYRQLKTEYDSIHSSLKMATLELNLKNTQQQTERLETELTEAQLKYQKLRNIGFGLLGALLIWAFLVRQKSSRLLKSANQNLLEEKKRSEELLLNILPAEVAKELKNHAAVKAKKHEAVTVLFSDFKNFSQTAKQLSPEDLLMELDFCFKEFDRIIDKHRLQKIKTIGDAYMCVGGLHTQGNSHVGRMILAALEIQRFLENIKKTRQAKNQHYFEARIGIHIGPVVSGVVGSKKFAFDIWGDTVNVAQQMETNGTPGKVNISGETYELIKDQFECTYRGKFTAKNKKDFDMYYVERNLNPLPERKAIYFKH